MAATSHETSVRQAVAEPARRDGEVLREGEGKPGPERLSTFRLAALIAGPALAALILVLPPPAEMSAEAWRLVSLAAWMVVWWLGEAVPIPATALLPIPLMPLWGLGEMDAVAASYADPLVFLFLGGFLLAAAMQRWGLHRRIALVIVGAVGISVVDFVARKTTDDRALRNFGVALMLAIAYSASIGGVGTLIGTPPNAFLASFMSSTYGITIDFFTWMLFGVPIVLVMLPIAWLLLTQLVFPARRLGIGDAGAVIRHELAALGPMSRAERIVAGVFLAAALGWIFRAQIVALTGLPLNDTSIALLAALVLFAWPLSRADGTFVLDWEAARHVPWGVLLLFGGGLALAAAFQSSGLAEWIGTAVGGFAIGTWLSVLVVAAAIVYLTEITSNTASTATFLPILGAVAVGLALDPRLLAVPVAVGASMAFMMPVATPPNAIVFSYERMKLSDMVMAGFLLNIAAIGVSFAAMYLLAGPIFGVEVPAAPFGG
jgi:sodium-dependent dicarboxylate transporter 2/3/5